VKRRQRVLEAVAAFWAANGYSPSLDEIADLAGLAHRSSVHHHLRRLRADGLVAYEEGKARTVRLTEKART
jgi:repressor LexA